MNLNFFFSVAYVFASLLGTQTVNISVAYFSIFQLCSSTPLSIYRDSYKKNLAEDKFFVKLPAMFYRLNDWQT